MKIADRNHRFTAFVIDWHIRTSPIALWGFVVFFRWFPDYWTAARSGGANLVTGWALLQPVLQQPGVAAWGWLCAALYFAYHPLIELAMHGDSPGKRMMGIRVVARDGARPSPRQVLIRNLWRAIEFLPFAWLWAWFAIRHSDENARTGDVIAGTRVVTAVRR